MTSGRDTYAGKYARDVERQAEWLRDGARSKADSVVSLARSDPDSVIEIGCGTGAVITELARRGFGRLHYAVDYSGDALQFLRRTAPGIRTAESDVTRECDPFNAGPYDVVVASHVAEHLEDPHLLLEAIRRMPHRQAVIEIPLDDLLASRLKARFRDRSNNPSGHVQFFTSSSFCRLVEQSGLRIIADHTYVPIVSMHGLRLTSRGSRWTLMRKWCTQRALPAILKPLWRRYYYAHYALLAEPPGPELASAAGDLAPDRAKE